MTTKADREKTKKLRSMDAATLADALAAAKALANAGGVMTAVRRVGVLKGEQARRAIGRRGDEDWDSGKWLADYRIPGPSGGTDEWKPNQKKTAVIAVLRHELGEAGFQRLFGFDSDRWEREITRRVGNAADTESRQSRADIRWDIASREFRSFAPGWARDVRNIQAQSPGGGLMPAVRRVAAAKAAGWLSMVDATDNPDATGRALALNLRRLLNPNDQGDFMKRFARALHDVVKPQLDAVDADGTPVIQPRPARGPGLGDAIEATFAPGGANYPPANAGDPNII
jgi:hypothetical protein